MEKEIEIENLKQEISELKAENETLKKTAESLEKDKNYAWKLVGEKSDIIAEQELQLKMCRRMLTAVLDNTKE